MKILLLSILTFSSLFSLQTSDRLFDCTEIFKERKGELLLELERIDEQKQSLSALKTATEELLKKREVDLSQEKEVIENKLLEISQKENSIKKMLEENKKVLKKIADIKITKIAQTFAKMKAGVASEILSNMKTDEAASLLESLKPKTIGQILSKMNPKKASVLTLLLSK